ncbi:MAG: hypothetical protein ABMA13_09145 [Chthoniobacteraceae bacterium]
MNRRTIYERAGFPIVLPMKHLLLLILALGAVAPSRKANLALRRDRWLYIGARGGGGFTATKPGEHLLGGPAALKFAGEVNSDVEDGRIKPDAPVEQLYDLAADPRQTRNVARENPAIATGLKVLLAEYQARSRTAR